MNPNSWDQAVSEGEKHGTRFEVYTRLLVCYATLFYHFFPYPNVGTFNDSPMTFIPT